MKKSACIFAFVFFFCSAAIAQSFTSNDSRVNLIELYTSEGCSSCPPADRWLSKLTQDPRLWSEFIPLSFHVDYWDYIGWKDPFAKKQFGDRQRRYAIEHSLSSVYTPGMLLNGSEWPSWRKQSTLKLPAAISSGKLTVDVTDNTATTTYQPTNNYQTDLSLNIAILGFDLKNEVDAGENNGRTLAHDFVVLGYQHIAMKLSDDGVYNASVTNLPKLSIQADKIGIAVWINKNNDLTPLQATGGWYQK